MPEQIADQKITDLIQAWPRMVSSRLDEDQPLPRVSQSGLAVNEAQAYALQAAYVSKSGRPVAGYKAALTAPAVQQFFGLDQAIAGVLFESGDWSANTKFPALPALKLETEVGFVCAQNLTAPVRAEDVFEHMRGCVAVVEIARPYLDGPPTGLDMIASNAASFAYLRGDEYPIATDIDDWTLSLSRDHKALHSDRAGSIVGGQAGALAWLVNRLLKVGYSLKAGHLLITGSVGDLHDGAPGHYRAEFGPLGAIDFEITATG